MRFHDAGEIDESLPAGPPPPALFQAMGEFGADGARNGTLVSQGGYGVLEVRSKAEVLQLAKRLMQLHRRSLAGLGRHLRGSSAGRIRDLIEGVGGDDSGGCRGGLAPGVDQVD
jgi:hypothetical protein